MDTPEELKYLLVRNIGRGQYGSVFEVKSSLTGDIYAAKVASGYPRDGRIMMIHEVDIHSKLTHPNIVQFISSFQSLNCASTGIVPLPQGVKGNCSVMVLELCSDKDLESIIKRTKVINIEDIKKWGYQIASGLLYLKEQHIIHKDIKPANILFCGDDVKLADFGFADFAENSTGHNSVGTPYYMPLEALAGTVSYASDLFAFGVILYRMYTSNLPYPAKEITELKSMLDQGEIAFDFKYRQAFERDFNLEDLIISCMAKYPFDRISIEQALKHPFFTSPQNPTASTTTETPESFLQSKTSAPKVMTLEQFRRYKKEFGAGTRDEFYLYLARKFPSDRPLSFQAFTYMYTKL